MANDSETRNIRACLVQDGSGILKLVEDLRNPVEESKVEKSNGTAMSQAERQKQIKVVGPDGKVIVFLNKDLQPNAGQESNEPEQVLDVPQDVLKPTATITESQAKSLATFLSSVKSKIGQKPVDQTNQIDSVQVNTLTSEANMRSPPVNQQIITINPKLLPVNHESSTAKPNTSCIVTPQPSPGLPRSSLGQGHHGHVILRNNTPVTPFLPNPPIVRQPSSNRPRLVYNRFPIARPQGSFGFVSNAGHVSPGNRFITLQLPPVPPTPVNVPRAIYQNNVTFDKTTNSSPKSTHPILQNSLLNSYQPQIKESQKDVDITVPLMNRQKYNDPILSRIGTSFVPNSGQTPRSTEGQFVVVQPKPVEYVNPNIPLQNSNATASPIVPPSTNTIVAMVPTGVRSFFLPVVLGSPPANNETLNNNSCGPHTVQFPRNENTPKKSLRERDERELIPPAVSSEVVVESCTDRPDKEMSPATVVESGIDSKGVNSETDKKPFQDARTITAGEIVIISDLDTKQTVKAVYESSQLRQPSSPLEGSIDIETTLKNKNPVNSEAEGVVCKSITLPDTSLQDKSTDVLKEKDDSSLQFELKEEAGLDDKHELDERQNTGEGYGQVKRKRKVPKRFITEDSDTSSFNKPRPKCRRMPFVKPIVFYPCFVVLNHLNSGSSNANDSKESRREGGMCSKRCREKFLLRKCRESCIQTCPFYEDEKKKLMIDHKYCKQTRRSSFGRLPRPQFLQSDHTHNLGANISSSKDQSLSDMPSVTGAIIRLPNPIDSLSSAKQSKQPSVLSLVNKSKGLNTSQSLIQPVESSLLSPSSETESALSESYISSELDESIGTCANTVSEGNVSNKVQHKPQKYVNVLPESNISSEVEETIQSTDMCSDRMSESNNSLDAEENAGRSADWCESEMPTEGSSVNKTDLEEPFIKDMNTDSDSEIEFNFARCSPVAPRSQSPHQVRTLELEEEDLGINDDSEESLNTLDTNVPEVDSYTEVERLLEKAEVGENAVTGESDIEDRCDWGLDLEVDPDSDTETKVNQSEPKTDVIQSIPPDLTIPEDSHCPEDFTSVPDQSFVSPERKSGSAVGSPVLNERVQRLKAMLDQQKQQLDSLRTKRRRTK